MERGKKVLSIYEPELRTYLGDAFCFSLLGKQIYNGGWIFDKYIDIEYKIEHKMMKYAAYDYYEFLPDQRIVKKKFHLVSMKERDIGRICREVIVSINREQYFFCYWNENIITNYLYHENNTEFYFHGSFIYGYDLDKAVFYSIGYFKEEWIKIEIPFEVYAQAVIIDEYKKGYFSFDTFCVKLPPVWELNRKKMIIDLREYSKKAFDNENYGIYNIYGEKMFALHLKDLSMRKRPFHIPSIYCMYEHKSLMKKRYEYMLTQGMVHDRRMLQNLQEIINKLEIILKKSIKYNMRMKQEAGEEIFELLFRTIKCEEVLMEGMGKQI